MNFQMVRNVRCIRYFSYCSYYWKKISDNVLMIFCRQHNTPSITKSILVVNLWRNVIELFVNKRQFSFFVESLLFHLRETIILPIIGQRDKRIKRCKSPRLYPSWQDNEETIVGFPFKTKYIRYNSIYTKHLKCPVWAR